MKTKVENAGRKGLVRRLLSYLKPQFLALFLSLLLAAGSSLLMLWVPLLVGDAVDCMVSRGQVDFPRLFSLLWRMAFAVGTGALAQWLMSLCNNRVAYRTVQALRRDAFARLQTAPLSYLDTHPHGDLLSRVISDAEQFADGLLLGLTQFFSGVVTICGTLLLLFCIQWQIALVLLCVTPLSLLVARFLAKRTYRFFRRQSEARGEAAAYVNEMIGGLRTVRILGYGERAQERFAACNEKLRAASQNASFFSSLTNPSTRFVNSIAYAAVTFVGALTVLTNPAFTVGLLSSFLAYANQYAKPFNEISGVVTELQGAMACAERLFSLIDLPQTEDDGAKAPPLRLEGGGVRFSAVGFGYPDRPPLFSDLSFTVKPGMQVAVVGPTGCGKTTLINLLLRFYDVSEGAIFVDGQDVRQVERGSLRRSYGMVLQETWMRTGTVRENIAMGRTEASEAEILAAARAALADGFIRRLPKGYDTVIGDGGVQIGEGEKQLLSIARVMLRDPKILILDEATSSIDVRTEMKVQQAFSKLLHGRTSFVVAHRLKTIQSADLILVMNDGKIIESGRHAELLAADGFYARLYRSQFDGD